MPGPPSATTRRADCEVCTPRRTHVGVGRAVTVLGLALILAGVLTLGYVAWEYFGTNIVSKHRQEQMKTQLLRSWQEPGAGRTAAKLPGDAIALLRIPRFGHKYEMPVLVGVGDNELASGVGWFQNTAQPGQVGNFAIAAHRVTHGEPFRNFFDLRRGDHVIVETRDWIYTYALRGDGNKQVVNFSQAWVLDPVPGHPQATPTHPIITLLTCSELFHTSNRSVVFGDLIASRPKTEALR